MTKVRCEREEELLDAIARAFVDSDLTLHAQACEDCSELLLVAGALLDERIHAVTEATVPTAGTMWLRMQIRQRQEAQAKARRSLMFGQAATLAIAVIVIGSLFGMDLAAGVRHVLVSFRLGTPLFLVIATWLVIAPVAGYVAIRQK